MFEDAPIISNKWCSCFARSARALSLFLLPELIANILCFYTVISVCDAHYVLHTLDALCLAARQTDPLHDDFRSLVFS